MCYINLLSPYLTVSDHLFLGMITSELKFGSYVLKKVILEEDEDTSTLEPVSDCCIGPIWTPLELLAVIPHTHDTRCQHSTIGMKPSPHAIFTTSLPFSISLSPYAPLALHSVFQYI